jgi:hypothetical protein
MPAVSAATKGAGDMTKSSYISSFPLLPVTQGVDVALFIDQVDCELDFTIFIQNAVPLLKAQLQRQIFCHMDDIMANH